MIPSVPQESEENETVPGVSRAKAEARFLAVSALKARHGFVVYVGGVGSRGPGENRQVGEVLKDLARDILVTGDLDEVGDSCIVLANIMIYDVIGIIHCSTVYMMAVSVASS